MNIALPAIVVFFLFLPGFIVRARFKLIERQSLDYSPFGQVVVEALILAGVLHMLWLGGSWIFFDKHPKWDTLLHLLASDPAAQSEAIKEVGKDLKWVAWYFGSLILVCFFLPPILRQQIVNRRLDRFNPEDDPSKYWNWSRLLRFHGAPWYYLLSGADEVKKPEMVYVSAIVHVGGRATLYDGFLDDYILESNGVLDRLILCQARRWNLKEYDGADDATRDALAFHIDGGFFVLRYSDTVTLNIWYVDESALSAAESPPDMPESTRE